MRPASASEYIGKLLTSKDPKEREVGRIIAGQSKTGEMTRAKALEMYLDPAAFDLRKQFPTFDQFLFVCTRCWWRIWRKLSKFLGKESKE
jgi:hypothetical protein